MKLEYVLVAVLVIAALAIAALAAQFMRTSAENDALKSELSGTKAMLNSTQKALDAAQAELEKKDGELIQEKAEVSNLKIALQNKTEEIEGLEGKLNQSEEELEEAKEGLDEAKAEISQVRAEANKMQEDINESIKWFRDNSVLPSTLKADRFINKVERECENDGTLRLACISYLMEKDLGFTYKNDPTGDRLYSIDEIISRKGGDCEDYSLFFKATLNRIGQKDLELEGWTGGIGRYTVYENASTGRYWYYDNAQGIELGNARDSNPYAVCYFYEIDTESLGHCVIMLTNRTIDSPDDISTENLDGSPLFEPQNGEYLGRIGGKFSACTEGESKCDEEINRLVFVISDDDLYEFNSGRWNFYHGYRERIGEILDELKSMNDV